MIAHDNNAFERQPMVREVFARQAYDPKFTQIGLRLPLSGKSVAAVRQAVVEA